MNSAAFSAYQLNCNLSFIAAKLFCLLERRLRAFLQSCLYFLPANGYEIKFRLYVASAESFIVDLTAHNKRARVFTTWILLHHSAAQR